jgi:hypothetical protein
MAEPSTLESILNFLMPIIVWMFLLYILYRIPIFKDMINWVIDKFQAMRERRQEQTNTVRTQQLSYE